MGGDLKNVTKCFLFSINLVTFIFGLVLFFLGVVLQTQYGLYFQFLDGSFYNLSAWCTGMGVVVCAVSFLGLYGAIRESYVSLAAFSVLLGLTIALELSLGVSAFALAKRDRLAASIGRRMKDSLDNYDQPGHEGVKKVWDILQTDFQCCGADFSSDWSSTPWGREAGALLPDSCCAALPLGGPRAGEGCSAQEAHHAGCLAALEDSARRNAGALGAIASVVALGQIGLVVAACHLLRYLERPKSCFPCY